ncbi:hypothetical protein MMU55_001670 [Campylobacter jejuni]|uniref:hypothetical protein n=2 Tax=Campylobacteraceae TaxID=72294 RepID=UPI000A81EE18|nr:hypothetical protein [Campylobacter jejuni]EIY3538179.1 hypothetical protein [Campylobacter jejuni]EMA2810013.1 hypothetical protein [Campylobacter jejuni]HEC2405850.1 hypothetical protein [Campylobacter jejuni]HEC2421637.1 hypothetical protein [Campylobacter jejuni]
MLSLIFNFVKNMVKYLSDIIAIANSYLTHATAIVTIATLLTAIVAIGLTMYYNRDRKKLLKEAIDVFLDKIIEDEELRNDFINKILKNSEFMEEFEKMVDLYNK